MFRQTNPTFSRGFTLGMLGVTLTAATLVLFFARSSAVTHAADPEPWVVIDRGLETAFQDSLGGYHKRGRALIAADFDLDGRVDFYFGNPGDESYVMRNITTPGKAAYFELAQVLFTGGLPWGAVAADFDNDGDYDLFVASGGNEGAMYDMFFRNTYLETGTLAFVDETELAGVAGPIPDGQTQPLATASANAAAVDYNQDGYVDIFVNTNYFPNNGGGMFFGSTFICPIEFLVPPVGPQPPDEPTLARNILWHNNGDGTFTNVAEEVGLTSLRPSRHSTWLDVDNDGDYDLYENNYNDYNILWRNLLAETGVAQFEDATLDFSHLPDEQIRYPYKSFVSAAADFNNDGWEDLIVFYRGASPDVGSPYPVGHALFLNLHGEGFVNAGTSSNLNDNYTAFDGVMGCQVGDVTGDGRPDVYIGNGGPYEGQFDQFYVNSTPPGEFDVTFQDHTSAINFPAPELPGLGYAPYPYRTHGVAFVDVDNNGTLEIAVSNGGPASYPNAVREPDRLFELMGDPYSYFKLRLVGDGEQVSRDAIGARVALQVRQGDEPSRTIYRTLFSNSCFSAQNGFELHFGLGKADTIDSVRIIWPDGYVQTIDENLTINTTMVVWR